MICMTCLTSKVADNGNCINGHDNWFEWDDLFFFKLYLELFDILKKKLNISSADLVFKLWNTDNKIIKQEKAIKSIFSKDFILGD